VFIYRFTECGNLNASKACNHQDIPW